MSRRYIFLLCLLSLVPLLSLTWSTREKDVFTRNERSHVSVPTFGLLGDEGYFTVSTEQLHRDGWQFPVDGGVVFRPEFRYDTPVWYIASPRKGMPVRSAMEGVVRLSRRTSLGRTVVIRHPNGLETVYANNAANEVKAGDAVRSGQVVARTGAAHGVAYTYFAVMVNGIRMNPALLAETDGTLKDFYLVFRQDGAGMTVTPSAPELVAECLPDVLPVEPEPVFVDLNRPFTATERQQVGVPTPGLFTAHETSFTLDLNRLKRWSYPLPGAKVISPYGGSRKNHKGTDLKTTAGDKIRAVFDGVVRFSGTYSAYGNIVVVRHANGLETCYSHNSKNLVRVGDRVKAGDVIAWVGRTGRATTEHCHFEVRVNGMPFNSDYLFDHAAHMLKNHRLCFTRRPDGGISIKLR